MNKILINLALFAAGLFLLPSPANCGDAYPAAFLEIGIDARRCGMGGAGGSVTGGPEAYFWNPAGIAFTARPSIGLMHIQLFDGMATLDYAGFAYPLRDNTVISFNAVLHRIPDIPEFPSLLELGLDPNNELEPELRAGRDHSTGSFTAYDLGMVVSVSRVFSSQIDLGWQYFIIPFKIPFGVNFKVIRQQLGEYGTARGIGVDAGSMVRIDARRFFGEREFLGYFNAGLTLQDIGGTVISWDQGAGRKAVLPYNTKISFGYEQPLDRIRSLARIVYDYDFRLQDHHAGMELTYGEMLAIRSGYVGKTFTAGAGLRLYGMTLDYAFSMQDFGGSHRISAGVPFGGK